MLAIVLQSLLMGLVTLTSTELWLRVVISLLITPKIFWLAVLIAKSVATVKKFAAGYFTNVYTGDMHLKNERGDWTIFEESDHLRIRNNLTGQTFKMGMTLIDDQ
jgi:hypothetical protein